MRNVVLTIFQLALNLSQDYRYFNAPHLFDLKVSFKNAKIEGCITGHPS